MYMPSIGDVILDNGVPMVVVSLKNYEDAGSCSYDRKYLLCEESYLRENNLSVVSLEELEQHGRWMIVNGPGFPEICKCKDMAPYEISVVKAYKIEQKIQKTIIVYE